MANSYSKGYVFFFIFVYDTKLNVVVAVFQFSNSKADSWHFHSLAAHNCLEQRNSMNEGINKQDIFCLNQTRNVQKKKSLGEGKPLRHSGTWVLAVHALWLRLSLMVLAPHLQCVSLILFLCSFLPLFLLLLKIKK